MRARASSFAAVVTCAFVFAGCGGSSSASSGSATPSTGAGGPPGCDFALQGPLVGYSYQPAPPPVQTGGPIADGIYDLVQVVRHTPTPGPWSSDQAPAFRWAIRFTTRDRSPNHASGDAMMAMEIPPAAQCTTKRFATFQTELRTEGGSKGIESVQYTATGDTLVMLEPRSDGGVPKAFVFRRRT